MKFPIDIHNQRKQKVALYALIAGALLTAMPFGANVSNAQTFEDRRRRVSGVPSAFHLPATEWDLPSTWQRLSSTHYRETYPNNPEVPDNSLVVVGRSRIDGVFGTWFYRPEVYVWVPDADSGHTWLALRWNGTLNKRWRQLSDLQP